MIIKTSELEGAALDWAVAFAIGGTVRNYPAMDGTPHWEARGPVVIKEQDFRHRLGWIGKQHPGWPGDTRWKPSINWLQGGPILQELMLTHKWEITPSGSGVVFQNYNMECVPVDGNSWMDESMYLEGDTLLIAGLRAYVCSVLGETVDVPEELVG